MAPYVISIILISGFGILWWSYNKARNKREEELRRRLEEEEDSTERSYPRSRHSIENKHEEDEQEMHVIHHEMQTDGLKPSSMVQFYQHILNQSEMVKNYHSLNIVTLSDLGKNLSIGCVETNFGYQNGSSYQVERYIQLIAFCMLDKKAEKKLKMKNLETEDVGNIRILRLTCRLDREYYRKLRDLLFIYSKE